MGLIDLLIKRKIHILRVQRQVLKVRSKLACFTKSPTARVHAHGQKPSSILHRISRIQNEASRTAVLLNTAHNGLELLFIAAKGNGGTKAISLLEPRVELGHHARVAVHMNHHLMGAMCGLGHSLATPLALRMSHARDVGPHEYKKTKVAHNFLHITKLNTSFFIWFFI